MELFFDVVKTHGEFAVGLVKRLAMQKPLTSKITCQSCGGMVEAREGIEKQVLNCRSCGCKRFYIWPSSLEKA